MQPKLKLSISMTTRAPRPGEVHGREYYFVSRDEFLRKIEENGFLEYAEYCGNFYGTPKKELFQMIEDGFIPVLEIETDGAMQVMNQLTDYLSIYLSAPDYKTLEKRLRGRGTETEDSIRKRLAKANEELAVSERYQNILINYDNCAEEAARAMVDLVETGTTESRVLVHDRAAFCDGFQK